MTVNQHGPRSTTPVFGCNAPKACGVSECGAYLVPRLPKAHTCAVWIGFGGALASGNPCVVTVTLNPWRRARSGAGCGFPTDGLHAWLSSKPGCLAV